MEEHLRKVGNERTKERYLRESFSSIPTEHDRPPHHHRFVCVFAVIPTHRYLVLVYSPSSMGGGGADRDDSDATSRVAQVADAKSAGENLRHGHDTNTFVLVFKHAHLPPPSPPAKTCSTSASPTSPGSRFFTTPPYDRPSICTQHTACDRWTPSPRLDTFESPRPHMFVHTPHLPGTPLFSQRLLRVAHRFACNAPPPPRLM